MLNWLKSLFSKAEPEPEEVVVRYFIGYTVYYGQYHNSPSRDCISSGWAVLDLQDGIADTSKVLAIQTALREQQPLPNPHLVISSINALQVWSLKDYQMEKQAQAQPGH